MDPGTQRQHWVTWSPESQWADLGEQTGLVLPSPEELSVGQATKGEEVGGRPWEPRFSTTSPCLLAVCWPRDCCTGCDRRRVLESRRLWTAQRRTAPLW